MLQASKPQVGFMLICTNQSHVFVLLHASKVLLGQNTRQAMSPNFFFLLRNLQKQEGQKLVAHFSFSVPTCISGKYFFTEQTSKMTARPDFVLTSLFRFLDRLFSQPISIIFARSAQKAKFCLEKLNNSTKIHDAFALKIQIQASMVSKCCFYRLNF